MQHRDDQPPGSPPTLTRPSLLSAEQQADAERLRAQTKPDAKAETASDAAPAARPRTLWYAGAGALVVLAAVGAWLALDAGEPDTVIAAPVPATAPATVNVPATPVASAPVADSDVSAAAILEDDTPIQKSVSLTDLLSAPAPGENAAEQDALNKLLDAAPAAAAVAKAPVRSAAKPAAPAKPKAQKAAVKAPAKAAGKGAVSVKPTPKSSAAKKKPAPAKAKPAPAKTARSKTTALAAAQDNDVMLLAALMSHSRARDAAARRSAAARTLAQCKQLGAGVAEQCRIRLCGSSARNDAECTRIAKQAPAERTDAQPN